MGEVADAGGMRVVAVAEHRHGHGHVLAPRSRFLLDEIIDRGIAALVEIVDAFEPDHGGDEG